MFKRKIQKVAVFGRRFIADPDAGTLLQTLIEAEFEFLWRSYGRGSAQTLRTAPKLALAMFGVLVDKESPRQWNRRVFVDEEDKSGYPSVQCAIELKFGVRARWQRIRDACAITKTK